MQQRHNRGRRPLVLALGAVLGLLFASVASAHDIPDQILLHGFVKPEGDRLHFVVRIPLIMLLNLNLPKRGLGYLDLAQIGPALEAAAAASARELALLENGRPLVPRRARTRISLPADRSFESYEKALAQVEGAPLPEGTNVFWNQGFFDAHLEYAIHSERSDFSLDMRLAPGLKGRLKLILRFLPPAGGTRAYELHGGFGRVALDPRWHQAAWVFVKSGFFHILDGIDHLLFLLCLVIPFRRLNLNLLAVITSFTVAHSITLIASAYNLVPAGEWFPPLVETLIAASIVYMALENIVAPNLRRRWLITSAFGLVHGFGFAFALKEKLQFAGDHLLAALFAFNLGVELGQILVLVISLPVLAVLFRRVLPERLGSIILSAILAHTGWHLMTERADVLWKVQWPALDAARLTVLARWVAGILLAIAAVRLIARRAKGVSRRAPAPS